VTVRDCGSVSCDCDCDCVHTHSHNAKMGVRLCAFEKMTQTEVRTVSHTDSATVLQCDSVHNDNVSVLLRLCAQ
jgi:hypothetical protein